MVKRKRIDNEEIAITTNSVNSQTVQLTDDGSASEPAITWEIDPDTGLYRIGDNSMGVSVGGTLKTTFNSSNVTTTVPLYVPVGSAGSPSISFSTDPDTGIYSISDNTLGISSAGTLRVTISSGTGFLTTLPISTTNSTDASSSTTGSIIASGGVGIAKKLYVGDSLFLPTSGGTATGISYFEEYTHTSTLSGIWASAQTPDSIQVHRLNNYCTLTITQTYTTANTASFITMTTALPTRFRPVEETTFFAAVRNNSVSQMGSFVLGTNGVLKIYCVSSATALLDNFATGSSGIYTMAMQYKV